MTRVDEISAAVPIRMRTSPRALHPAAWWVWAIGLAVAATRTTNPLLLGLIIVTVLVVVSARRSPVPWAGGLRIYLVLAVTVVAVRVVFRAVLGGGGGSTVLFTLPELVLPEIVRGIRVGGPVSAEGLLASFYDGLRLAAMLVCVGAANLLADPRRLLKSVPGALYEIGTATVVALSIAPQLVTSAARVRQAQALRGVTGSRWGAVRRTLLPVLTDALDNSIALAAAMDSRGYGRAGRQSTVERRRAAGLLLAGLMGICIGLYGLLDGTTPAALGWPAATVGSIVALVGLWLSGRRVGRTRYRADRWRIPEVLTAVLGLVAAAGVIAAGRLEPQVVFTSTSPVVWPELSVLAVAGVLLAVLPSVITPSPTTAAQSSDGSTSTRTRSACVASASGVPDATTTQRG